MGFCYLVRRINSCSGGVKASFQMHFFSVCGLKMANFSNITKTNRIKLLLLPLIRLVAAQNKNTLFLTVEKGNLIIMHHFAASY